MLRPLMSTPQPPVLQQSNLDLAKQVELLRVTFRRLEGSYLCWTTGPSYSFINHCFTTLLFSWPA